jgi:predicted dehydrogenase/threonine dehydrogenase-like Zn-dependent dehydrogenase
MKQVVQNYGTGELWVEDVPVPACRAGGVLVRTAWSLVSAGTERMKVDQARMSFLKMARSRPDKVAQVVQSVRQVGVLETVAKVRERLGALSPLGYSLSGVVDEVGAGLDDFRVGDRVACGGEGTACHAEFAFVPRNLCVRVPDEVDLRDAAFTTVGAIAMHGVRQAGVTIGDSVVVIGLGLVGLLAVQILKAAGCRVLGVDVDATKLEPAIRCGADVAWARNEAGLEENIRTATGGHGPDAVYVAASTSSTDPMELAGRIARDRGRVVIVGMVKMEADWRTYYEKELSVVMSRSYGPGRYDRTYEVKGVDYPIGHVRWTQRRNFAEFLRLAALKKVSPSILRPVEFGIEDAAEAYGELRESPARHSVGILFRYREDAPRERRVDAEGIGSRSGSRLERIRIGVIGAGNFATGTLIPALKRNPSVELRTIASAGGLSARSASKRHGFLQCGSDADAVFDDPAIDAVIIATRHDSHAAMAAAALRAGKHVFVEKPLALDRRQLEELRRAVLESDRIVMPGFNRRFSPLSIAVREHFAKRAYPLHILCRINAGAMPSGSWYQDSEEGGWRIVSEGCHFVDLIQFLAGAPVQGVRAEMIGGGGAGENRDNCAATLSLEDGSVATLLYLNGGDAAFEKERIEVFGGGTSAVIENWRQAVLWNGGRAKKIGGRAAGKGHVSEINAFVDAVRSGGPSPIPFEEAAKTTAVTFDIAAAMTSCRELSGSTCFVTDRDS